MSATSPSSSTSTPAARSRSGPPAGELVALSQLSPGQLDSLSRLEAACLAADGGRLKLEWASLRRRPPGQTSDFCYLVDGELVGFVGLYQWRPIALELCGMVHPSWRRRGIGSLLYEAAAAEIRERRPASVLLIVDRHSLSGQAFAHSLGGELSHSEHRMRQSLEPEARSDRRVVRVRRALAADARFLVECLAAAFNEEVQRADLEDAAGLARILDGSFVIEDPTVGEQVGVMRVEREGGVASIYGFAVLPERQGKGYGRAALLNVSHQLRRSGVGVISLEVLSDNDGALHLYESCGFEVIGTEDYFSLPLG